MRNSYNEWKSLNLLPKFSINIPSDLSFNITPDISGCVSFLLSNFSPYLMMSQQSILHHLLNPFSTNITLLCNNDIIAFIHSRPITIRIDDISHNINYVEYLCVDPKFRKCNIASIMIGTLINTMNELNSDISRIYLFKKDGKQHPFMPFLSSNYLYHQLSNINPSNDYQIVSIENLYVLWFQQSQKHKFAIYISQDNWNEYMSIRQYFTISINNQSYCLIGQTSILKPNKKVFDIEYIVPIPIDLSNNNSWSSFKSYMKHNGYVYITMNDISDHKLIINDKWDIGNSFQYYLYNGVSPNIDNIDVFFTIN
jgi:hypothetical protein